MTSPFEVAKYPDNLVNISTGVHATADIQKSMVGLVTKGENMMETFVSSCLEKRGRKPSKTQ